MTVGWIGIADINGGCFNAGGLGTAPSASPVPADELLPRGTILLETGPVSHDRPQTLLSFHRGFPWSGSFTLKSLSNGGFFVAESQGSDIRHGTLRDEGAGRGDVLRLTYTWDAPAKWGRLTLERPDSEFAVSVGIARPHPMPMAELRRVVENPCCRSVGPDVAFFAVSSRLESVGPMPGLAADVPITTASGQVPVADLKRGDLVATADDARVPVLQAVSRVVPARGSLRPVLLRAPYFGLCRDLVVAPQQRLLISGTQVDYMFGRETVLVQARHLVNEIFARYAEGPPLVRYHQLLLPGHEALQTAGATTESLYIGRLRRKPDELAASVLAGCDRSRLPEHAKPVHPVLKPYEAVTLALNRAA